MSKSTKLLRKVINAVSGLGRSFHYRMNNFSPACPYFFSLCSAMSAAKHLKIVVIGANDGRINDPVYSFCKMFPNATEVFLIEPQHKLLPYLQDNYAFHPFAKVINAAVGETGFVTLHGVCSSIWPLLRVDYAEGWPAYRAPTGITSGNLQHVRSWLQRYGPAGLDVDSMITRETVKSVRLPELLQSYDFAGTIDVLQIDTEGMDDIIIFNSGIDELKPRIIRFERENLSSKSLTAVVRFLEARQYMIGSCERDILAVLVSEPDQP